MNKRLILTDEAIRNTDVKAGNYAKRIIASMINDGHIRVKTRFSWIGELTGKYPYTLRTRDELEDGIKTAIQNALDLNFKKRAAMGTDLTERVDPSSKEDGYIEFFYKKEFVKELEDKDQFYWDHPYLRQLQKLWEVEGYYVNPDRFEGYSIDTLDVELYEAVMADAMLVLRHCWKSDSEGKTEGLAALERVVREELRFVPMNLSRDLQSKIEYRVK